MHRAAIWFKATPAPKETGPGDRPGLRCFWLFFSRLADLAGLTGLFLLQRRLGRGKTRHGNAEWTAAYIREADAVAELHRRRLAAVLPADAELDIGTRLAALLDGDLHELADARLVDRFKRVALTISSS